MTKIVAMATILYIEFASVPAVNVDRREGMNGWDSKDGCRRGGGGMEGEDQGEGTDRWMDGWDCGEVGSLSNYN